MAALKIFISHSSRLRDDETSEAQALANWQLLQDTCAELATVYGDKVEVLVDYQELHPGDDWSHRLHALLSECEAAIILFSRRAIEKSDWVKIETTVLAHRRIVDSEFKLFSVTLPGQSKPDDLEQGYFGNLGLARWQTVPNAATAPEIVRAIQARLGDPATLPGKRQTAFQRKHSQIEDLLARHVVRDTLVDLWEKLCPGTPPPRTHAEPGKRYVWALAEHLLTDGEQALQRVQQVLDHLPELPREPAAALLKCLNALWVDATAASVLSEARSSARCLALNGRLVDYEDPEGSERPFFTLNRYLKRAWPETRRIRLIPVAQVMSAGAIRDEIRKVYQRGRLPLSDDELDRRVLADEWQVIVFLAARLWPDGVIDPRLVDELQRLKAQYHPLIFVLGVDGSMRDDLPEGVQGILPELNLKDEDSQHETEIDAWNLIKS